MTAATVEEPGYLTWGPATAKLLRTMRLEAARSGHGSVLPPHVVVALLDQPEMHQALRAARQRPDVYAMRARVAAASLAPSEYSDSLPFSPAVEALLSRIRAHSAGEDFGLLYLLTLKECLSDQACRTLLRHGKVDLAVLDAALSVVE